MKHFNDQFIQALDTLIEKCEEYIDQCGQLSMFCTHGTKKECTQKMGPCIEKDTECIKACHEGIKQCQEHVKICTDDKCKKLCQTCITNCHGGIRNLGNLLESTSSGGGITAAQCDECTASCNECADSANQLLKYNSH